MTPRTLFPDIDTTTEPPLARHSDPQTSHLAADYIRPHLGRLHQAVIDTLRAAKEPMTASEIGPQAHKRMKELVEDNRIEKCGERKCSISGRLATVYRIRKA